MDKKKFLYWLCAPNMVIFELPINVTLNMTDDIWEN